MFNSTFLPAQKSASITLFSIFPGAPRRLDLSDHLMTAWELLYQMLSLENGCKLLALSLVLLNLKVFPFIYHLRILNAVRFVLRSQRPKQDVTPEQLFQPLITSSKACLMEIDVFGHKSNSTYFTDIDVARAHLVTTMFGKGIEKIRGGTTMNGLNGKRSNFTVALGGVSCTFRKELLPYETYDMWTRILSWDEKWMYLVTHFVKRSHNIQPRVSSLYPQQNSSSQDGVPFTDDRRDSAFSIKTTITDSTCGPASAPITASALSKIVFKNGRVTIPAREMLEASNLLPAVKKGGANANDKYERATAEDDNDDAYNVKLSQAIEEERQQGLRLAALLANQTALHDAFNSDIALGRHFDGMGLEGVVATLAQLGKVSPYQLI
ncbi:hypothetical protein A1O1_06663 [Capronia coronata CBS 617.96]|uniref:Capsule polysaccharide biosynthesis protein n=1 Tax=Capronia coronata CBS 617.96 TaxID=1182541 RepID=W9Y1D0_9EURO|nr:uncharacterized protein A1O1_06663 [Capronia coronata CBS 617.96]EXJ86293.1 hypothetical protein A1O1_06663 [Capronia coronata CBS 617.96]